MIRQKVAKGIFLWTQKRISFFLHNLLTNLCLFTGQQTGGSDKESTDKVNLK